MKKKIIGLIDGQSGNIGSIKKAIKDIIKDNRGFRNFLSLHTEDYLHNKNIKINLIRSNNNQNEK